MSASRVLATLLLAASLLGSAELRAQAGDITTAKRYYGEGKRHFAAKRYGLALRSFQRAYARWSNRAILYNIALCHALLGQPVQAARRLRKYLRGATRAERALPEILRRVQSRVGILYIQLPDPQAAIFIDAHLAGYGRANEVVSPGAHQVSVRRDGQEVLRRTLRVSAGQTERWIARSVPAPQPVRRRSRSLSRLHPGYFYAAAGLALACFGVGVGLYVKTKQVHRDYLTSQDPSLRETGIRYQNATNAMLGLSAGALVAAGILAIFSRFRSPAERGPAVAVTPPRRGRGILLGVSWVR